MKDVFHRETVTFVYALGMGNMEKQHEAGIKMS